MEKNHGEEEINIVTRCLKAAILESEPGVHCQATAR
jgi:hypothetical protein